VEFYGFYLNLEDASFNLNNSIKQQVISRSSTNTNSTRTWLKIYAYFC
jgi:hypothetical protein